MLLASAQGQHTSAIARSVRCNHQTVRNAIHDFARRGLAALLPKSSRSQRTAAVFSQQGREALRALLHQSPRTFGKPSSVWTLELAAEVSFAQGITSRQLSHETLRSALKQLGVSCKRANHCSTSPARDYLRTKPARPSNPLGDQSADLGTRLG